MHMSAKHASELTAQEELGIIPSAKSAGLGKHFESQVKAYYRNKDVIAQLEKANNIDKEEIATALATVGVKRVMVDGLRVTLVDSSRDTLHKDKLLELGVPADTIVSATTTSHFSFIRVDDTVKRDVLKREKVSGVEPIAKSLSAKKRFQQSIREKVRQRDQVKSRATRNRSGDDAA